MGFQTPELQGDGSRVLAKSQQNRELSFECVYQSYKLFHALTHKTFTYEKLVSQLMKCLAIPLCQSIFMLS